MNKAFKSAFSYAVAEGDEDDISLMEITSRLCEGLGLNSFALSASDTEKLLQSFSEFVPLLLQSQFVAGNFERKTDYVVWPDQSPAYVADRIKQEWHRLKGRMPSVNFIAYFRKIDQQPVKRRPQTPAS